MIRKVFNKLFNKFSWAELLNITGNHIMIELLGLWSDPFTNLAHEAWIMKKKSSAKAVNRETRLRIQSAKFTQKASWTGSAWGLIWFASIMIPSSQGLQRYWRLALSKSSWPFLTVMEVAESRADSQLWYGKNTEKRKIAWHNYNNNSLYNSVVFANPFFWQKKYHIPE